MPTKPRSRSTYMLNIKIVGQTVQPWQCTLTDKQADGGYQAHYLPAWLSYVVDKHPICHSSGMVRISTCEGARPLADFNIPRNSGLSDDSLGTEMPPGMDATFKIDYCREFRRGTMFPPDGLGPISVRPHKFLSASGGRTGIIWDTALARFLHS